MNVVSFINLIENINKLDKQLIAEIKKSINVNLESCFKKLVYRCLYTLLRIKR